MPDLHPGKGIPIGASVITDEHHLYPELVDYDIGCGMCFVRTGIQSSKMTMKKLENLKANIESIDGPYPNATEFLSESFTWAG